MDGKSSTRQRYYRPDEWEKRDGGIKWPNAKLVGTYYGVDPETLVTREDETADGEVVMQVLDGARADQLDRIEEKVEEILKRLPVEDDQPDGDRQTPEPPPIHSDPDEQESDEEETQRRAG